MNGVGFIIAASSYPFGVGVENCPDMDTFNLYCQLTNKLIIDGGIYQLQNR